MMKEEFEKRVHEFAIQIYTEGYKEGREDAEMDTNTRVKGAYEKGLEDTWNVIAKIGNMTGNEFRKVFGFEYDAYFYKELSASEAMQKIKEYEESQKQDEKIDIRAEYEKYYMPIGEENMRRKREQREQAEKCEKCTKEISAECVVDGCEFEAKQTDATDIDDGSIKVGDEVRIKGSDPVKDDCDYGICTRSLPKINTIYVMRRDGSSGEENKDEWYRTGRTFPQIAEVLRQLRGEE